MNSGDLPGESAGGDRFPDQLEIAAADIGGAGDDRRKKHRRSRFQNTVGGAQETVRR